MDGSRYTTDLFINRSIGFYDSVLTISDLSVSRAQDNGAQYYCVVEISVDDTLCEAPYIIPGLGTAMSDNITVTLEGTQLYTAYYIVYIVYSCSST